MSVDIIFKIAAIGILISVLNHVLNRAGREEISMMVTLAGIVVVLLMVIDMISKLFNNVKSIFQLY
ncbi:MAG: stage sporulation protein [Clostridiales bacterium]|jgi:stage III sporulation protein AC|uniref:Stage III sporulation protein AC n=1 Tax=Caldicoprobacter faecalis TaxID=937334 RepID=A0A1I5U8U2_9FIRM|nr:MULTISPECIES: stage III sporulation protein AC [Caldicoprobacter]MCM8900900.1 stage III sporulation protein AC [Caldicoprobacter algeriensis]MDN5276965.1 stage sporulation protein [Clostridiales bacterium]PZN09811.1 MAG: stage III sporulation protein AC [Caldicoprobacter oshimai]SFP91046.1 stage III sporulation protein AC [Caldicoprobacter faecalis]